MLPSLPPGSRLLLAFVVPWAAHAQSSSVAQVKTHQLYIGTDLQVEWQGGYVDVARFDGSRVVVRDGDDQPVVLPKMPNVRWERRPKVSRALVSISNLDHARMYSVGQDPARTGTTSRPP